MQFNSIVIFILISIIKFIACAPTEVVDPNSALDKLVHKVTSSQISDSTANDKKRDDYYEWRHGVAEGVQKALDVCREKFKWDRWNCPKKAFLDILDRSDSENKKPMPSNKELGLTRSLIAAGIVLSLAQSCNFGSKNVCGCSNTTPVVTRIPTLPGSIETIDNSMMSSSNAEQLNKKQLNYASEQVFLHQGCDESIKFAFKVSKTYLESQDIQQDEASRKINAHNYEVGRLAVQKTLKRKCKCHGTSGACQMNTCWTGLPDMSEVGEYLKRRYRLAAKVGAMSAVETNVASLNKELGAIAKDKLVFAEASPDYCYENTILGINGTLGRYCSRAKHRDGKEVSRSERDSCDRLCTKCGYKIKRERITTERQCECRFVYCCSVECKTCPYEKDTYKCVRHS